MPQKRKKIGQIFIEHGIIDEFQLRSALSNQRTSKKRLGEVLVELGYISENALMKILSKHFDVPSMSLDNIEIEATC